MSIVPILLIIALVLFTLASFNVGGPINLTSAGLAFLTLALLVSRGVI